MVCPKKQGKRQFENLCELTGSGTITRDAFASGWRNDALGHFDQSLDTGVLVHEFN
jgi:hypothetical protein